MTIPKIPYFQTSRYRVATMVELANPKPEDLGADLGSGDGRIVIAFAKAGITMHGYEIDDALNKLANENIAKENLTLCHSYNISSHSNHLPCHSCECRNPEKINH